MASRKAQALIKAARTGDGAARLALGRLYLAGGEGLAASPQAAFHWLAQAAAGGSMEAAREIALGIPPEAAAADAGTYAQACRQAAEDGSAAARRALGELLLEGRGVAADPEAALEAFRAAAGAGDMLAAARLGALLAARPDGTEEARPWLERAAASGVAAAGRRLADLLWRAGDAAAAPWLRAAAREGDMEAACRLGELLAGQSGDGNDGGREGAAWLERAARQGHARALWRYGRCYAGNLGGGGRPVGLPRSLKQAARLLEQAAAAGIAEAWWDLARLYAQRGFSGRDLARARQCLETAARLGVPAAQLSLGETLAARKGELKSLLEAGRWLSHALEAGEAGAAALLETLAGRARPWPEDTMARQETALAAMAKEHAAPAARLRLAARFDLDARETLFLDPRTADRGWCLLADVGKHFAYKPWRLVRVETAAQREALARLRTVFAGEAADDDFEGAARTRKRRLESLLRRLALDPGLFIRDWQAPWAERDRALREATTAATDR